MFTLMAGLEVLLSGKNIEPGAMKMLRFAAAFAKTISSIRLGSGTHI
jgi:hypothetical protein